MAWKKENLCSERVSRKKLPATPALNQGGLPVLEEDRIFYCLYTVRDRPPGLIGGPVPARPPGDRSSFARQTWTIPPGLCLFPSLVHSKDHCNRVTATASLIITFMLNSFPLLLE